MSPRQCNIPCPLSACSLFYVCQPNRGLCANSIITPTKANVSLLLIRTVLSVSRSLLVHVKILNKEPVFCRFCLFSLIVDLSKKISIIRQIPPYPPALPLPFFRQCHVIRFSYQAIEPVTFLIIYGHHHLHQ